MDVSFDDLSPDELRDLIQRARQRLQALSRKPPGGLSVMMRSVHGKKWDVYRRILRGFDPKHGNGLDFQGPIVHDERDVLPVGTLVVLGARRSDGREPKTGVLLRVDEASIVRVLDWELRNFTVLVTSGEVEDVDAEIARHPELACYVSTVNLPLLPIAKYLRVHALP